MPESTRTTAQDPAPDRDALRADFRTFDERQQKIAAGMITLMIESPERVREREWIAEQFTQVTLLASGFEETDDVQVALDQVQGYITENINPILNACFRLFQFAGEDLAERDASTLNRQDAVAHALTYILVPEA